MHSSHYITQLTSMSTPHYAPKGIVSHKSILDGSNTTNDTADDHINEDDDDAKMQEHTTPSSDPIHPNNQASNETYSMDTPNDKHHHIPSIKRHIKRMQKANNKAITTQSIDRLEATIT
eukprot:797201_1